MGHRFRMVLCDEHQHDAEKKSTRARKAGQSGKRESGGSGPGRNLARWKKKMESRLEKKSLAMLYTFQGYEVTPGVHPGQRIADLKFSLIAARDRAEYYEGLVRMMSDPNGSEARWRSARRVAGARVINAVYFDKIEFNESFGGVLTIDDAKEQVVLARRSIERLEDELESARREIERREADASAERFRAFKEHLAAQEA